MPRSIEQSTLDIISGKSALSSTQSLLDNALAVSTHKMKQREQGQMYEMRNMEIQQGTMELSELQKQADIRDMESEQRRRQATFALKNQDQLMENELYKNSVTRLESEVSAKNAITEKLIASPDTQSFQAVLEQNKGLYSPEFYEQYSGVNWSNPKEREANTQRMISDIKFEQDKRLQQLKSSGESKATPLKATPWDTSLVTSSLKSSGISAEHADSVAILARDITNEYRESNVGVQLSDVIPVANELLSKNPDKYLKDEGGVMGMWTDKTVDNEMLSQDIKAKLQTGYTVDELNYLAKQNDMSVNDLVERLSANN